jgi:hypothetical protein
VTTKLCALAISRHDGPAEGFKRAEGELLTFRRPGGFRLPADALDETAIAGANS